MRHEGFTSRESCECHGKGWQLVLAWLTRHCAPSSRQAFLVRLLPPRPSFLFDMNEAERRTMGEHAGYWQGLLEGGTAVAFGPVADPKGAWGLGLLELEDGEAAVRRIEAQDPAIVSGLGFRYEILNVPQLLSR